MHLRLYAPHLYVGFFYNFYLLAFQDHMWTCEYTLGEFLLTDSKLNPWLSPVFVVQPQASRTLIGAGLGGHAKHPWRKTHPAIRRTSCTLPLFACVVAAVFVALQGSPQATTPTTSLGLERARFFDGCQKPSWSLCGARSIIFLASREATYPSAIPSATCWLSGFCSLSEALSRRTRLSLDAPLLKCYGVHYETHFILKGYYVSH